MCSDSDTVGRQHEGGARRTSTREEDEQGAPFLMRLYMLVNLSRSNWIQRLLSLGRYLIRRPRSGSARLSRSRRHAPVRHRQTTATTPASSCPLYSLSHPALRQCKTTMAAGTRGVVRGGPAAYIRVSLSELENKHLGDGHLIVHDVLQAEARRRFVEIGGAANRVHLRGSRRRSRRQRAAARAGRSARLDGVPRLKHHTVDREDLAARQYRTSAAENATACFEAGGGRAVCGEPAAGS